MSDWQTRQTLLQRASNPTDEAAWQDFVVYYQDFIRVVLLKMKLNEHDMDDLTQEILMRIWKALPTYDQEKAGFRTWMSSIIRNIVIDHYRKVNRQNENQKKFQMDQSHTQTLENDVADIVDQEWEAHIVKLAMSRISKHFSERAIFAFTMSMNDWSSEAIGEKLDIKANSVNKLKNRVKQRLLEEIAQLKLEIEP